jgi:hypothetical protein
MPIPKDPELRMSQGSLGQIRSYFNEIGTKERKQIGEGNAEITDIGILSNEITVAGLQRKL